MQTLLENGEQEKKTSIWSLSSRNLHYPSSASEQGYRDVALAPYRKCHYFLQCEERKNSRGQLVHSLISAFPLPAAMPCSHPCHRLCPQERKMAILCALCGSRSTPLHPPAGPCSSCRLWPVQYLSLYNTTHGESHCENRHSDSCSFWVLWKSG